jgi:hypothetical protein
MMRSADYKKQRLEGSKQIVAKLRELAKDRGFEIESIVWNRDGSLDERAAHELAISARGKSIIVKFSDEQLADYPGRVGTAKTDAMVRNIVADLGKA